MNIQTTVAFTGYRTAKILKSAPNNPHILREIAAKLDLIVEELHLQGYRTFLSGMAIGFDMLAAEAVLKARRNHPDIELLAIIPFKNQPKLFSEYDKMKYENMMLLVDQVIIIEPKMSTAAYFTRNDFLVDNAAIIVCYYDGQKGGTRYTVERAYSQSKVIKNIA